MRRKTKDALRFVASEIAMPLTLLLPLLLVLEVLRYGAIYLSDRDSDWGGWFMLGVLLGTVALFPLFGLLFGLVGGILSGKRVVNWRAVRVVGSVALVAGGFYYQYAVRCVGRSGRDSPQPYDVAKYQVYSAFLNDLGGRGLLIQDDTRPLLQETPGSRIESLQQFDRKLTLNVPYQPVSADTAHVLFNWQKPPEVCKPYEGYDRLVVFSAVDFNSDQTFAVVQITLLRGICAGPNKEPFGWSGPRMLQKKCGKWKVVRREGEGFSDVAIN
jgi:hypothetical protein